MKHRNGLRYHHLGIQGKRGKARSTILGCLRRRGTPGIVVAMVEVDGAPVEFIQIDRRIVGDEYDARESKVEDRLAGA
ncbi:MAG: hypothetical protein OXH09_01745 [Gammaproteobacteria bacterium]|nr:hypothetical protein [Gammaproteobacteria bacterium]